MQMGITGQVSDERSPDGDMSPSGRSDFPTCPDSPNPAKYSVAFAREI